MPNYEIDYEYDITEGGVTNVISANAEDASAAGYDQISTDYPLVKNLKITAVRETTH